jgi:hypothetical protein
VHENGLHPLPQKNRLWNLKCTKHVQPVHRGLDLSQDNIKRGREGRASLASGELCVRRGALY